MNAAIYARKSTGQHVADDAKSVTRQVTNAKAFAASKGWTVEDKHIFIDDGISGAETKRLLERARMIESAAKKQFDVVIMQAQDRFSRGEDGHHELKQLARHVAIWFYSDASRFEAGTFASNTLGFLKSEFASEYRRAIAAKTTEAMLRKAQLGYATGGRTFGYDHVPVNGNKERRINQTEATIVRDIYERYANGEGFKHIAHALNAKHVRAPRPQKGRPAGWDQGTIQAILKRPIYRGTIIYNKTKKRDAKGERHRGRQEPKQQADWITVNAPHLRIVDDALIAQVDVRLEQRRHKYLHDTKGRLLGRPRGASDGKNLLAGFIQCACGATFEAVRGQYVCSARRRKGPSVCASSFSFAVEGIDAIFLDAIEGALLRPEFIDHILDDAFAHDPSAEHAALVAEQARLTSEVTNLTKAIAAGGDIPALAEALRARDSRLRQIAGLLAKPMARPDRDVLKAALELRSGQWREVLRSQHIAQARMVLQHLVDLPIRIHNQPKPKWIAGVRRNGLAVGLIQNLASPTRQRDLYTSQNVASPAGFEPALPP
jgi:site-specific DNA recombinase